MRARLRAAGRFAELSAPAGTAPMVSASGGPSASTTQISGVLKVPAILFRFKDSPSPLFVPADYDAVLFATTPSGGRPYTYRSFYQQMSNGVFDIQGQTYGYANLDSNEVYYTGGTNPDCQAQNPYNSTNCNGLFDAVAISRMQSALTQSLAKLDAQVDFSQYVDPASGFVPLVLFMHEAVGGECGPQNAPQNHLWAHRFALPTYTTQDDWPGHPGVKIKISDYILQPAVGGATACDPSQIMPIGTVAHETGHGFGLPDLYDTKTSSEGIGQWGLMSSGNFTSPLSPTRMEAWSLNELGWITLAPLTVNGTYSFDAAPVSDTAFYVRVPAPNTRGEYFLIENRQRQQSDSAMIRIHCAKWGSPGCPGGLLIWHVDSTKMYGGGNALNSGTLHGLELMQADGFRNLDADAVPSNLCTTGAVATGCSDRGDAGDLYPGTTGNVALIYRTNPASVKNSDGSFTGVAIDSIQQLLLNRTMSFRLRFGGLTVVRATDTTATILFDGSPYKVFRDLLDQASTHTVGFSTGQVAPDGRTRWFFSSWSDSGPVMNHSISGKLAGDTVIATLARQFKLSATTSAPASITADTAINLSGDFIPDGRPVQLTPSNGGSGLNFCGWTGDSTTTDSVLTLGMLRPYTLVANFGTNATITSGTARPNGTMGAAYSDALTISGGGPITNWTVIAGALPQGVTLSSNGQLSGFPQQTGNFNYTAQVVSCDTKSKAFTLSVTAPTLATSDVVAQLLGPTSPLSADQVRYLDFLGNSNGSLDIGDFLAWVKATGAPLTAAALQAVQQKGNRR